jgi:hypothetical protein
MRFASPFIAVIALLLAQTGARADISLETVLAGKWRVFWISEGRVSPLSIDSVAPQGKITNFSGSIVQGDENCRMTGNVVASSQLDYREGLISTEVIIPAIINISVICSGLTMKMEALGLSDSEYLMSGRAIVRVNGGAQLMLPVALAPAR